MSSHSAIIALRGGVAAPTSEAAGEKNGGEQSDGGEFRLIHHESSRVRFYRCSTNEVNTMLGSGGDGSVTSAATPRPGPPSVADAIAASIDTAAAPLLTSLNKTVRPMRKPATRAAAAAATPGRNHEASTSHVGAVARRNASSYPTMTRATKIAWPVFGSSAAFRAALSSGSGR